jgi:hypothetical protein
MYRSEEARRHLGFDGRGLRIVEVRLVWGRAGL